jgi:perosamine synthetase
MEPLLELAAKHNIRIIEDAAEVHGASCLVGGKWRPCGSFGDISTFSFYANKNITTGEGGMVLTDDDDLATKMRDRRTLCFGRKERFRHEDRGWNFRMTNIQAALGCAQLEQIDRFIARKREMAALYNEGLRELPLQLPVERPWARSSVWMYAIVLPEHVPFDAAEFALRLQNKGVQTRPFFLGMHEQPVYLDNGFVDAVQLPVTERISRRGLYLPSGQAITNEQIAQVIQAVRSVLTI